MKTKTISACKKLTFLAFGLWPLAISQPTQAASLDLNFNSGVDSLGHSQGDLVFNGPSGFQVVFTDDDSSGGYGGNANGVHITNSGYANSKAGSADYVLGAYNSFNGGNNYHSSGIVAKFNQGVTSVSIFDSDDDFTDKTFFAFGKSGNLLAQDGSSPYPGVPPGVHIGSGDARRTFSLGSAQTSGQLIYSIEFDTLPSVAGGSSDGTYFTIDNFHVEYSPVPIPGAIWLLGSGIAGLAGSRFGRKKR